MGVWIKEGYAGIVVAGAMLVDHVAYVQASASVAEVGARCRQRLQDG